VHHENTDNTMTKKYRQYNDQKKGLKDKQ